LKATVLGSSCSTPTKDRNLSAVNLNFNGLNYLFDCPEGTQRQMMKAKVSYMKVHAIFLSHFHGDHILGLPGLIATMSMHQRDSPLFVFGPKGVKEKVKKSVELSLLKVNFELKAIEVREGVLLNEENFFVSAVRLNHDIPCYGYIFKEKDSQGKFLREKALALGIPEGPLWGELQKGKTIEFKGKKFRPEQVLDTKNKKIGKKISVICDTLPSSHYVKAIEHSDLLFHESSFLEEMKKRAKHTFHCTAMQAAGIAEKAKVKKLILFHLSPRHKDTEKFEIEARQVFADSIVAEDLMEFEL